MSSFSNRFQQLLVSLGITAKAMGENAGLPYRTLQSYLRGESEPNTEALVKISRTGVNLNWLITGEGEMFLGSKKDAEIHIVEEYKKDVLDGYTGNDEEKKALMLRNSDRMDQFVKKYNDSEDEIIWKLIPSWVRHYVPFLKAVLLESWLEEHEKSRSAMKDSPFEMRYYPALMGRITETIKDYYAEWFNDLGEDTISSIQEKLYTCFYKLGATNDKLPEKPDILTALALARKLKSIPLAPGNSA